MPVCEKATLLALTNLIPGHETAFPGPPTCCRIWIRKLHQSESVFSSHKDNGQDAGGPSMTVSTNTSACLWSPLQDLRSVHYQQKVVPQKVFNWTKVFSPWSERPPALLQATITVNPSKTVESQQQKTAVSLKQRSLCLSLLRPAEIQLLVSVPLLVVDMLLKWNRCLHWLNLRSGDGNYRRG